jgi:hypothetical protein
MAIITPQANPTHAYLDQQLSQYIKDITALHQCSTHDNILGEGDKYQLHPLPGFTKIGCSSLGRDQDSKLPATIALSIGASNPTELVNG